MSLRCPRCAGSVPVPSRGHEALCPHCGHAWRVPSSSDAYLPVEAVVAAAEPLTERHRATADQRGEPPQLACPVCGHAFAGAPERAAQMCPACGSEFVPASGQLRASEASADPLIGSILRGCLIDRKLGEGGMGAVYHARQLSLERSVAIKILPPELARNRSFIQRFEREAKSLARINHPNILQIYDFGEERRLGIYFMVIEFVDGWDLGEILHRQGRLSQLETVDIVRQALLGLEQAAEKGVIHRDIKPDNLMMSTQGVCKVSDFGLAKALIGTTEVTSIGVRVGTPAFMSPEQCDGVEIDSRSDVYNLGCTAFLMLTGRLPYEGETPFSIMLKHKMEPVPSALALRPELDPRVDALVRRMMAKDPAARCQDLHSLIDEVERLQIALAGTASVLRKTSGPVRALLQAALQSQGAAAAPPAAAAREQPPPVVPAARSEPRQPSLVDTAAAAPPPQASAAAPPPTGAAAGELALAAGDSAAGKRAARPDAASPPEGESQGAARKSGSTTRLMAVRGEAASGASTKLAPSSRRAASAPQGGRSRGSGSAIAACIADAERHLGAGNWQAAAQAWERAAQLCTDEQQRAELLRKAAQARWRGRWRRAARWAAIACGGALLTAVGVWALAPLLHRALAERELERLLAIPDPAVQAAELRRFAAAEQGGWSWYRRWFGSGYEVEAATVAARAAESASERLAQAQRQRLESAEAAIARLQRLLDDRTVSWQEVSQAAAAVADPRAEAVRALAERRIAAAAQARRAIELARAAGRHGEALDLAAAFRREHARAGPLLEGLPLPGRVRAVDPTDGAPIDRLRLQVDGVALVDRDGRFCRSADSAVQLEVSAPDRVSRRLTVPASRQTEEEVIEVALAIAPRWRTPWPGTRPLWLRLLPFGDAAIALAPDGIQLVHPERGELRPLAVPGIRWASWLQAGEGGGWLLSTADGELRQALPGLDRVVPVRRLPAVPLARWEGESAYRPGVRITVSIERDGEQSVAVARVGERVEWRVGGLLVQRDPLLLRSEDALVVADDRSVLIIDEAGSVQARHALPAPRLPAAAHSAELLALATEVGVWTLRLAGRRTAPRPLPMLDSVGPALLGAAGELLIVAGQRPPGVAVYRWRVDAEPELRWQLPLSGKPLQLAIGGERLIVADEAGVVAILRLADGALIHRFGHGTALLASPLLVGEMVLLADQLGVLAGYPLPAP
ncbi:MAG: protein kinase [Planctomycetes bacterium]|nr:protein kinase [Planctomycetota bacterium]